MRYFLEVVSLTRKTYTLLGEYIKKESEFYLKEISKQEIEKLIKAGIIRNSHEGYVNPKKHYRIGYYKTCGGHRYIEDWYADKAKTLR